MERIDAENENMRKWQEETARNDGYRHGETIEREVVVDASYAKARKEDTELSKILVLWITRIYKSTTCSERIYFSK